MIDRYALVNRHNPTLNTIDYESPLTVGNGEFAFTADVTGLQTLYTEYKERNVPLCTMSQWGWHSEPAGDQRDIYYTLDDLDMTEYDCGHKKVYYAVEKKQGNEHVYDWLRQNPHRLNLARIAFRFDGAEIKPSEISQINQTLDLYHGCLISRFLLHGYPIEVETVCGDKRDVLSFRIQSEALVNGSLEVYLSFPYGSPDMTASNWNALDKHTTRIIDDSNPKCLYLRRQLDKDSYNVAIKVDSRSSVSLTNLHEVRISATSDKMELCVLFSKEYDCAPIHIEKVIKSSSESWKDYWDKGAAIDLHRSKDERALELERRIVLSQYLTAIQSCGSIPPQETGLTCNSWYGKFHLEMHLWHSAYLPLWNRTYLLKKSLAWYKRILPNAKRNAKRNGYKGAKWPKMVAFDGIDSPSVIATLLIWQQPHIIYMLELIYQNDKDENILKEFWNVVWETAEYMCDFVVYNSATGRYDLPSPLIPAQEEHDPRETRNPTFELEYWSFALGIAVDWARRLGLPSGNWEAIARLMAKLPQEDNLYLAHENCPSTFEKINRDHPSMVGALGLLPGFRVDDNVMERTLNKVIENWDFSTMWGWDFAMMAMTAVRLNKPEQAIDILMIDSPKNSYVTSGNNYQRLREDLPLYLPGNGSLLLAIALMTAGYEGCETPLPGFPKNGMWEIEYENMRPFPY